MDEKRFTNATPSHRTTFTTKVIDLESGLLLDVLKGRTKDTLGDWLEARRAQWCSRITVATLDSAAGYRNAMEGEFNRSSRQRQIAS